MFIKNNPNVSNWNLESGYQSESNEIEYPIRLFDSYDSLVIFLSLLEDDIDYVCSGLDQGFRVFLTMPGDAPRNSRYYLSVSLSETTRIRIKSKLITTSDGLRQYRPNERQCFFSSERRLRFFNIYTQYNCKTECLANFTKIKCGCVHFSMPSMIFEHSPLFFHLK